MNDVIIWMQLEVKRTQRSTLVNVISKMVERKKVDITNFCQKLIRIPSTTGDELKIQNYLISYLKTLDLKIDRWEPNVDIMSGHPAYIPGRSDQKGRSNVVGIYSSGTPGRSLLLNGHVDVISPEPGDRWCFNPWSGHISDGKIWGRGAWDMKAGITSIVKALEIIKDLKLMPAGKTLLEFVAAVPQQCTIEGIPGEHIPYVKRTFEEVVSRVSQK